MPPVTSSFPVSPRLPTRDACRESPDDPAELLEGQAAAERVAGMPLGAFEERQPESPLTLHSATHRLLRVASRPVHAVILAPPMTCRPATVAEPGDIEDEGSLGSAASADTGLLVRLALWLAEVSAEAALARRFAADEATGRPLSEAAR